ncbi:MAG: lipocalin-like domain-containing protein [Phenylobacterium sp.]
MSTAVATAATPQTIDLVGMWRLVGVTFWKNGELRDPHGMGPEPAGYIAYTREGRVTVVLDRRSWLTQPAGRGQPPIFCYAGTYTREGAVVTHHLEICTALEHIGTDYVRVIEVQGDHLFLCTEPVEKNGSTSLSKLEWAPDRGAGSVSRE